MAAASMRKLAALAASINELAQTRPTSESFLVRCKGAMTPSADQVERTLNALSREIRTHLGRASCLMAELALLKGA
jgi:hypothetical protein